MKYKASYTTIMAIHSRLSPAGAAEWMQKASERFISWSDVADIEFPNIKYDESADNLHYLVRGLSIAERSE